MSNLVARLREAASKPVAPLPLFTLKTIAAESQKFDMTADDVFDLFRRPLCTLTTFPRRRWPHVLNFTVRQLSATLETLRIRFPIPEKCDVNVERVARALMQPDGDTFEIVPTTAFTAKEYDLLANEERLVFDLIAHRFIDQFKSEASTERSQPSQYIISLLTEAADTLEIMESDVCDEDKGLWRFWNRLAREMVEKMAAMKLEKEKARS